MASMLTQNMLLWIVPASAQGKDIGSFCAPGGLVDRMIQAATQTVRSLASATDLDI